MKTSPKTVFELSLTSSMLLVAMAADGATCMLCDGATGIDPTPTGGAALYASKPDAALQFAPCLPSGVVEKVAEVMQTDLRRNFAGADVFPKPYGGTATTCVEGKQKIGIWLRPQSGSDDAGARERGYGQINVLTGSESFGIAISADGIRRRANQIWANTPKTYSHTGGAVHLTGFNLNFGTFTNPWTHLATPYVSTVIKGYDDAPMPDVSFTYTVTDRLSLDNGKIACGTSENLDTDTGLLDFLTGLFMAIAPVGPGGTFAMQNYIIGQYGTDDVPMDVDAGPGCVAARLIPPSLLLPRMFAGQVPQKADFNYSRLRADSTGITAAGSYRIVPRQPNVGLDAPAKVRVELGETTASAKFKARTYDLRAPLTVTWSNGATSVNHNTLAKTLAWSIPGLANNQYLYRSGYITVTDADGLVAGGSDRVRIEGSLDPDLPEICDTHPTRFECQL
jgi:hypothetical protein